MDNNNNNGSQIDDNSSSKNDNGVIFGYLALFILMPGIIQYIMHLTVFILGHDWAIISMVHLVNPNNNSEDEDNDGSSSSSNNNHNNRSRMGLTLLTLHAFLAMGLLMLCIFQYGSGLFLTLSSSISKKKKPAQQQQQQQRRKSIIRPLHQMLGYPVACLWLITMTSGLVYTYGSPDIIRRYFLNTNHNRSNSISTERATGFDWRGPLHGHCHDD